ncbi:MAG: SDR family oxidoreductase, partial [Acidimicrobiia bacterium]
MALELEGSGRSSQEVLEETIQRQRIRRLGTPREVAELAVFLCSPRARHVQGVALSVDGGAT